MGVAERSANYKRVCKGISRGLVRRNTAYQYRQKRFHIKKQRCGGYVSWRWRSFAVAHMMRRSAFDNALNPLGERDRNARARGRFQRVVKVHASRVSAESIRGGDDTAKIALPFEVIRKNYEKDTNATFSPLCSVQAECRR